MFDKYLSIVVAFAGMMIIGLSIISIYMGKKLEKIPTKNDKQEKSLTGPEKSTQICAIFCFGLYCISSYTLFSTDTVFFVLGLVGIISSLMFLFTSVVLSFAVVNTIKKPLKVIG